MPGDVRRTVTVPAEPLLPGELIATTATAADHPDIFHFLAAVLQRPSPGEFQSQLDDPHYRPQDRLLVRARTNSSAMHASCTA